MGAACQTYAIESCETIEDERLEPTWTETTLFDLIEALQAAAPDDDAAVIAAVTDLLQTGRIRMHEPARANHGAEGSR